MPLSNENIPPIPFTAVNGIGGMFSLDNGTGKRFLTKSEICLVVDNDPKKN